jgi:hypothetical protein
MMTEWGSVVAQMVGAPRVISDQQLNEIAVSDRGT